MAAELNIPDRAWQAALEPANHGPAIYVLRAAGPLIVADAVRRFAEANRPRRGGDRKPDDLIGHAYFDGIDAMCQRLDAWADELDPQGGES